VCIRDSGIRAHVGKAGPLDRVAFWERPLCRAVTATERKVGLGQVTDTQGAHPQAPYRDCGHATEVWQTAVLTLRREPPRPSLEALVDAFSHG